MGNAEIGKIRADAGRIVEGEVAVELQSVGGVRDRGRLRSVRSRARLIAAGGCERFGELNEVA
jgi:hypothetical protein